MFQEIKDYVMSCKSCQINKRDYTYRPASMGIPSSPFEILHMDIVTVGKESLGYRYVLSIICAFSKFVLFAPLKTQTADEITETLYHRVIADFGPPKARVTVRGQNFLSHMYYN